MSIEQLNLAFKADIQKSSVKFVLVALADYANEVGEAYPTIETIASKTALNRKTIIASLKELSLHGLIVDTGLTRGKTGQVKVWKLQLKSSSNNSTKIGTVKESQKVNSTENGTVPFFPDNDTENGTVKESQKRDTEPSVSLTISEPPVKEKTRAKKFTPPTAAEVDEFARQNSLNLDGFFEYYGSNGWRVGKNPMKDWHLAAHGWHKRQKQFNRGNSKPTRRPGEFDDQREVRGERLS